MRRHARAIGVAIGLALLAGLAALPLDPHPLAKEGPIEHVSHAVLAFTVVAWVLAAARITRRRAIDDGERSARSESSEMGGLGDAPPKRRRKAPHVVAVAMALVALVLLMEETDWLGLYGLDDGAHAMRAWLGRPNFHTAGGGRGYPYFVVPIVLYFAAPHLPRVGARARALLGPAAPSREVAHAFLVAFVALAATQLAPIDPHNRFEEGAELALYATLGLAAWETMGR